MKIEIIESGFDDNNNKLYYLIVDFGKDINVMKLTESELKSYSKKIYTKVNNLLEN